MNRVRGFFADTGAAGAAEFAMVVPVLIISLFAIIDGARYLWTYNMAEKATQAGVRHAVVTNVIPTEFNDDFALTRGVPGGDAVPTSVFSTTTCTSSSCSGSWGHDPAAFTGILTRMKTIYNPITAANVRVRYDNVGLGFAGDPNGPDVSALVTVELINLPFQPITPLVFRSLSLPTIEATMTMEDGSGTVSN